MDTPRANTLSVETVSITMDGMCHARWRRNIPYKSALPAHAMTCLCLRVRPLCYNGRSPEPLLEAHPLQQSALAALRPPRVMTLRTGAPPGMYEGMYHKTAQACSIEKRMISR